MTSKIYCNPLPLPDYPRGRGSFDQKEKPNNHLWLQEENRDFRETADPSVIYEDGKWYLYPSCGMAYVSEDFCTWKHMRIEPYDCGYAPTVVKFRGKFLLTACGAPIYEGDTPLGPFTEIGRMQLPDGEKLRPGWSDPMLFADGDRLYAYWGLGNPGIFAAELNPDQPNQLITAPAKMFEFNPEHTWERYGEWNEDPTISYCEGSWMIKINGRYFLTYAGPGTTFSTYAMGAYVSDSPLGPFTYQQRNPILSTRDGLIRGPGHGCIVRGPKDTLWAFYTCVLCYEYGFERRTGMDPAGIDADGNLFVAGATQFPQLAPGTLPSPEENNDTGLLPCNHAKRCIPSSFSPGRNAIYCTDNSTLTWWQPANNDLKPSITFPLRSSFDISAIRLWWRDEGLDYDAGVLPGPFQYKIEGCLDTNEWFTIKDNTQNQTDMLIDFLTFDTVSVDQVRLIITSWPKGITPTLIDCSIFGVRT
jgi:xylan 1,4-beta-xylosidase